MILAFKNKKLIKELKQLGTYYDTCGNKEFQRYTFLIAKRRLFIIRNENLKGYVFGGDYKPLVLKKGPKSKESLENFAMVSLSDATRISEATGIETVACVLLSGCSQVNVFQPRVTIFSDDEKNLLPAFITKADMEDGNSIEHDQVVKLKELIKIKR